MKGVQQKQKKTEGKKQECLMCQNVFGYHTVPQVSPKSVDVGCIMGVQVILGHTPFCVKNQVTLFHLSSDF